MEWHGEDGNMRNNSSSKRAETPSNLIFPQLSLNLLSR
jgi:hypothetical protein